MSETSKILLNQLFEFIYLLSKEVEDCVLHAACCRGIFVIIVKDIEDDPSNYTV